MFFNSLHRLRCAASSIDNLLVLPVLSVFHEPLERDDLVKERKASVSVESAILSRSRPPIEVVRMFTTSVITSVTCAYEFFLKTLVISLVISP